MANQAASIDPNQYPALIGHAGTADGSETRKVVVGDSGEIKTTSIQMMNRPFDTIVADYPSGTVETYAYFNGGTAGTNQGTVTVTYLDAAKGTISSVETTYAV